MQGDKKLDTALIERGAWGHRSFMSHESRPPPDGVRSGNRDSEGQVSGEELEHSGHHTLIMWLVFMRWCLGTLGRLPIKIVAHHIVRAIIHEIDVVDTVTG